MIEGFFRCSKSENIIPITFAVKFNPGRINLSMTNANFLHLEINLYEKIICQDLFDIFFHLLVIQVSQSQCTHPFVFQSENQIILFFLGIGDKL